MELGIKKKWQSYEEEKRERERVTTEERELPNQDA